jgi:zinc-ribbon domain
MAEVPQRYCGNCGHELSPENRFCPSCGRPVHRTAHVPTPEANAPVPPPPQQAQRTAPPPQASFSIREMVVLGVGAGVFTLLTTTQLGNLPGKLFFAILAPMMGSVIASIIKVYLSGAAVGGRRLGILGILTALWRFGDLPGETQKSLLLAGLRSSAGVGLVSFTSSVSTVVGFYGVKAGIDKMDFRVVDGEATASYAINCAINCVTVANIL